MTRSKLIERIKASDHPDMLKAQIIAAIYDCYPEIKDFPPLTLEGILYYAGKVTGCTPEEIKGNRKHRHLVRARTLYAYIATQYYSGEYVQRVAAEFINRDRSSISECCRKFSNWLKFNDAVSCNDLQAMEDLILNEVNPVYLKAV